MINPQKILYEEVSKIEDPKIKLFTETALENADPEFWTASCSGTGKHHPPEDQGIGGLQRHLVKATIIARQFARRAMFSDHETDMAVAATILHDIQKNGIPWGESTYYAHGIIGAEWLEQFPLADPTGKREILDAVKFHMAPWHYVHNPRGKDIFTQEEMLDNLNGMVRALLYPRRIELAVREGDYWGSREDASFYPGQTVIYDARVHDSPEEWLEGVRQFNEEQCDSTWVKKE